jgi:hypothetical protein
MPRSAVGLTRVISPFGHAHDSSARTKNLKRPALRPRGSDSESPGFGQYNNHRSLGSGETGDPRPSFSFHVLRYKSKPSDQDSHLELGYQLSQYTAFAPTPFSGASANQVTPPSGTSKKQKVPNSRPPPPTCASSCLVINVPSNSSFNS